MKGKRAIAVSGLVGAVTIGAMALAGPAAKATTIIPNNVPNQTLCDDYYGLGIQIIQDTGNPLPNPPTAQNVIDYLEFFAVVYHDSGELSQAMAATNTAEGIGEYCLG